MKKKEYKYNAFISYRHCDLDKFVAENLHRLLESYELPKEIKEKLKIEGRTIRRVFRDQEELPLSSNLEDPILDALNDSKYLIVICSPRLKDSLWCKKEIETFDKVFQEIDFLLTEIKIAVSSLGDNSAEKVIKNNIDSIKDVIAFKTNICKVNKKENFILLSNLLSEKKDNIKNDFSIAIYGKKNEDDFRLNMILQSYGIFTRIVSDSQAMLSLIQNKVIQFVIMRIDNENDECLRMCEKIREKYSSLDLPIMFILNKYNSYLVEKFHNFHINDFLITPFDLEVLFSRIQIMLDYKKLFDENKELLKSEKEKTVFLYFVTHNVNTPLTVLLNEVHALNDYKDALSVNNDDGGGGAIIDHIQESASQINIIIQNVLNSYRISEGHYLINPCVINLKDFLLLENQFFFKKAEFKKQSLTFECKSKNPLVFCDENSLKGIFTNLVDNAIKYTKLEGHIKVRVYNDKEYVYLQIIDDGQGIPEEKQAVLFNKFSNIGSKTTYNESSVGLGLYVVNEICKLNNLIMEYTKNTEAETGSVFTVKFNRIS